MAAATSGPDAWWRAVTVAGVFLAAGCQSTAEEPTSELMTVDGTPVVTFRLENQRGTSATLISLGATLTELQVADRNGVLGDVVLGYQDLGEYEANPSYLGCTTGRVCNRIANARFRLEGMTYFLAKNDGDNHLHGGRRALHRVIWNGERVAHPKGSAVRFSHRSPDGDEGYPGNLTLQVTYVLTETDELRIEYEATTDAVTPVNLTNHAYFNLRGARSGDDVLTHELQIAATEYTPTGEGLIPTGELARVEGTPLDFTRSLPIGWRIDQLDGGYDHNFALRGGETEQPRTAAVLHDPESGRTMEVLTTQPGLQLYTANHFDGSHVGKGGVRYESHAGVCLETQHFPNAINEPKFASIVLAPGETYRQVTVLRFRARPRG